MQITISDINYSKVKNVKLATYGNYVKFLISGEQLSLLLRLKQKYKLQYLEDTIKAMH